MFPGDVQTYRAAPCLPKSVEYLQHGEGIARQEGGIRDALYPVAFQIPARHGGKKDVECFGTDRMPRDPFC